MRRPKTVKQNAVFAAFAVVVAASVIAALITGSDALKQPLSDACGSYRDDGQVRIKGDTLNVEIPRDTAAFARGLGGRPCITANQGMLFEFSQPGQYAFWMKDMKFPIDILWIGPGHQVVYEAVDLQPSSYPQQFVNRQPAQYVLETIANLSKQLHIGLGTPVSFKNT